MKSRPSNRPLYGEALSASTVTTAFTDGVVPVAVYGLGKMGLPLAGVFADITGSVEGVDIDEDVVEAVERGECHVTGEPDLPELIANTTRTGALSATTNAAAAAQRARLHVIIVPTLLTDDKQPDLSMLEAAVNSVASGLVPGDMVVVESTVPPTTCRDLVAPRLRTRGDTEQFGLAFCPERTASGRALRDIRGAYPKIVGGVDAESSRIARGIYDAVTDNRVVEVGDARTAEAVKVFEGLYRDVNIALANELATVADPLGIDVIEAIDAANTQPYCDIHDPGPGVGGHCIPYYPYFLTSQVSRDLDLLRTARSVNDAMPDYVVKRTERVLSDTGIPIEEATILILGATYRAGVEELRKSPARPITGGLDERGASVRIVDPLADVDDLASLAADPLALDRVESVDPDAVIMMTAHEEFDDIDYSAFDDAAIVDTRRVLEERATYVIGRGDGVSPKG